MSTTTIDVLHTCGCHRSYTLMAPAAVVDRMAAQLARETCRRPECLARRVREAREGGGGPRHG